MNGQRNDEKLSKNRSGERQTLKNAFASFRDELLEKQRDTPFVVFLCGPSLKDHKNPGTRVRKKILDRLKKEGIDVVLGEDEGLDNVRLRIGMNAQDNELEFIKRHCDSIIVVAGSVGSFCELGLFSWHYSHKEGRLRKPEKNRMQRDFIALVAKKYRNTKKRKSYLNEGPGKVILAFGMLEYIDFEHVDLDGQIQNIISRVLERRATYVLDRRGRPPKKP